MRLYPETKPLSFRGKRSETQVEPQNKTQSQTKVISKMTPKFDVMTNDSSNKSIKNSNDISVDNKTKKEVNKENTVEENKDMINKENLKNSEEVIEENKLEEKKTISKESDKQESDDTKGSCSLKNVKLVRSGDEDKPEFSFQIQAIIAEDSQEGLYSLFFHNCPNYGSHGGFRYLTPINLSMTVVEINLDNYLSAGEIPLPQLYFALSVIFFLIGVVWIHVIRNKKGDAFKIHYLMGALVFVKALSLLFHGVS